MKTCLVNLAYLDPAQIGGVGRIAHEVSRLLATQAVDARVIFIVSWRFAGEFAGWLGQSAVVVPFITSRDLRLTLRLLKPDVIVSPLFGLEPFTNSSALHIAGMPDALALDHPELFTPADLAYRQQVYAHLTQAFRVVTLTEHARTQLLHHLTLPPEKIAVVPLGAEPQVSIQTTDVPDLPAQYIFYPANVWPHKRHDLLMRIFGLLCQQQPDLHLIMTGGRSAENRQHLQSLAAQYKCPPERIHDLGYVDDSTLIALYRHAQALLFVSQYEGFGMPLLEAMQQGCPVICAPLAAIPEVVGDAAIYVDSDQPDEWVKAVLTTLPQQRTRLIEAGRERAAQFTWAKTRDGWQHVLSESGLRFSAEPAQNQTGVRQLAVRMQPLLEQVTQLSRLTAHSRARQIVFLPRLILLQVRLLWLARGYGMKAP